MADMTDNKLIEKITGIVVEKTVRQKIPTLVFISNIRTEALIKNIISKISGSDTDIFANPPYIPWNKVAEIMEQLTAIPLLIKETSDGEFIKAETDNFIRELNKGKGLVIVNFDKNLFTPFTTGENTSIIVLDLN